MLYFSFAFFNHTLFYAMKAIHFTTAAIGAMPPEQRLSALMILILAIAGYLGYTQLNNDVQNLRTDLKACNESRITRLESDIAIRDSQQIKLMQIVEQNSDLMRLIKKKVCNQ